MMQTMMQRHAEQMQMMERRLEEQAKKSKENEEEGKLKALNTKDIKLPGEYTGKAEEFNEWYHRFQALLLSRHKSWKGLLEVLEECKDVKLKTDKDGTCAKLIDKLKLKGEPYNKIPEQYEEYKAQLYQPEADRWIGLPSSQCHRKLCNKPKSL